jgi:hypothetical protein
MIFKKTCFNLFSDYYFPVAMPGRGALGVSINTVCLVILYISAGILFFLLKKPLDLTPPFEKFVSCPKSKQFFEVKTAGGLF